MIELLISFLYIFNGRFLHFSLRFTVSPFKIDTFVRSKDSILNLKVSFFFRMKAEERILVGINRKDKKLWGSFYDCYYAALCSYMMRFLKDSYVVEDLVQKIFITIWDNSHTFVDICELTNYLYQTCYNTALNYSCNNKLPNAILSPVVAETISENEGAVYAVTMQEEITRQFHCFIKELPVRQHRITLLHIKGYFWEDIALRLGISINVIRFSRNRSYVFLHEKANVVQLLSEYRKFSEKKAYVSFLRYLKKKKKQNTTKILCWFYSTLVIIVLVMGLLYCWTHYFVNDDSLAERVPVVMPGDTKAQLVLSDGRVIDIGQKEMDVSKNEMNVSYRKGTLSYVDKDHLNDELGKNTVVDYNKLVVPEGGEYTVELSDGSVVRLNAGSELTYPVKFAGNERRIILGGEAFFDVAEDEEHPFVVQTQFGSIKVKGTTFNVNAYNGENICYTTLVRGIVEIKASNHEEITLKPTEQAVISLRGIHKKQVNVNEYIGWVNGLYVFKNKSLAEVMKTFSRWYDVTVYFETDALRNLTCSGYLKRYETLNAFLNVLKLKGEIKYTINGKNVLIYGKDKKIERN